MGARPLRRAVQRFLEDPLAEEILRGDLLDAGKVNVIKGDGGLVFSVVAGRKIKA
jgi:ATP-dependent Clp protease ATP-binding subunit ClpA